MRTCWPSLLAAGLGCGVGESAGPAKPAAATIGASEEASTADPSTASGTSASEYPATGTGEGESSTAPVSCPSGTACGQECVEVDSDVYNCGECGRTCVVPNATAACVAGQCAVGACEPGSNDCDGELANGCEVPGDCYDCNGLCNAGKTADCRQPVHRSNSPTLGYFYTLDEAEASSGDFTLEAPNYFFTYTAPAADLVALHRCLRGNGTRFYSLSETCEGSGTNEGDLGNISADPGCDATPLFRLYDATNDATLYTVSTTERDEAIGSGWTFEDVTGYVWLDAAARGPTR